MLQSMEGVGADHGVDFIFLFSFFFRKLEGWSWRNMHDGEKLVGRGVQEARVEPGGG